jgi:PRTRC genetic system protein C
MAKVSKPKRVFIFNGKELPDPDPTKKPQYLINNVFSKSYPSLASGTYKGPIIKQVSNGEQAETYELRGNLGTKG